MHTHFGGRRSHVRTFETIQTDELRRRMELAIETMIATLDAIDSDPDFEPANDDEPALGWTGVARGVATGVTHERSIEAVHDDREDDDSDREPDVDDELSSGWINEGSQATLRADDEQEPSLGWPEEIDQLGRVPTVPTIWMIEDGEQECEDEGADDEREQDFEGAHHG